MAPQPAPAAAGSHPPIGHGPRVRNTAEDWYQYATNKSSTNIALSSGISASNMIMYFTILDAPEPQHELGVASYKLPRLKQCLLANIVLSLILLGLNVALRLWPWPLGLMLMLRRSVKGRAERRQAAKSRSGSRARRISDTLMTSESSGHLHGQGLGDKPTTVDQRASTSMPQHAQINDDQQTQQQPDQPDIEVQQQRVEPAEGIATMRLHPQDKLIVGEWMNTINNFTFVVSLGLAVTQSLVAGFTTAPSENVPNDAVVPDNNTMPT